MQAVTTALRLLIATASGVIVFLGTMVQGCDDQEPIHSWDRCRSWLGNRTVEWPGGDWSPILPLLWSIAIGYVVWRLLGRTALRRG